MKHFEFGWTTRDAVEIYAQGWEPDTAPRAVICLVHGLGEHSGRYAHVAEALGQAGITTLALDQRGHGKTPGQRGHAPSFETLMDDIDRLIQEADGRYPGLPQFLYGHSMGGSFVLNFVLRRRPVIAGAITTAPALKPAFQPPAWKVAVGKLLSAWWPGLTLANGLDVQAISRDPEIVRRYVDDPLVHDRISARLGTDILRQGLWALEHAGEFCLPLLLMHGSADRLTSAQASREFAVRAGDCCTLKIWEGFFHELHNEPEQEMVLRYVIDWLGINTKI
ncbi:MAG: lysophospholipase [Deltaproteobacteria bacterium]|nr:lysophospholipase [Deltaproteobacteria bacterium]